MSIRVKTNALAFVGAGLHKQNVEGPLQEKMVHFHTHFLHDTLPTDDWLATLNGTGETIAINVAQGGRCRISTGTVDDDSCMVSLSIIFSGTKKAVCEVRVTINDVSGTGLFVGFSDARSEVNGSLAIHYPADVLTTVATDAAGFVIDADHATSSIMCASVLNGTDTTPVDTGTDWADGETKVLRVELDSTTAIFYLDGVAKASIASSVTAATLLCFTIQAITRANDGANTIDIDRVDVWQDE